MRRILPAFVMAVLIHTALLTADPQWLFHHAPLAPQTQVITMQLVDRVSYHLPTIRPVPPAPSLLPPVPKKQTVKKTPVVNKPKTLKKIPPAKKAPVPPPLKPTPILSNPEPATFLPETPAQTLLPATPRSSYKPSGEPTEAMATVVMATPRYSENPPPAYPTIARRRGYQGTVILDIFVKENGRVGDLRIFQSSTHKLLDRAAMKAIKRWQFEPGRRGDLTLAMWVRVPVHFRLQ